VYLVESGRYASREKARAAIMAGSVYIDGRIADKAGMSVPAGAVVDIRQETCPYVSRGGLKLQKALTVFQIDATDMLAMDIGASTEGFTDCLLQGGAKTVYAVDVGYGQLDYRLRTDERVINLERCNIRYLDPAVVGQPLNLITIDVSFISLRLVFPVAAGLLKDDGNLICLVKPQFEAGREQVGKGGIVRNPKIHAEVIEQVCSYGLDNGLDPAGLTWSPVTGAKGNIEYLLHLIKRPPTGRPLAIEDQVAEAHARLNGSEAHARLDGGEPPCN
jgi:23S rRNA (cytidine1920-2'-O)/16S rRNA (cytidine1409-2'-O)-methyltransferase